MRTRERIFVLGRDVNVGIYRGSEVSGAGRRGKDSSRSTGACLKLGSESYRYCVSEVSVRRFVRPPALLFSWRDEEGDDETRRKGGRGVEQRALVTLLPNETRSCCLHSLLELQPVRTAKVDVDVVLHSSRTALSKRREGPGALISIRVH